MGKKIVFKASEDITKETIEVGDSFMAYESAIYHESIYQVSVTRVEGATVELACKWFAISDGYDLGMPQHFRLEKNDRVWSFTGKLYKGKVTRKGQYVNTVYKLIRPQSSARSLLTACISILRRWFEIFAIKYYIYTLV